MSEDSQAGLLELAREQCAALELAAAGHRAFSQPRREASPPDVHTALVQVRARLDLLEGVLAAAMQLKSAAAMRARELERIADDAWDDEAEKAKNAKWQQVEYEGAQERYAIWRLRTREQRRAARTARDIADLADSTEARIRLYHRGLDSARLDLHRRLSALAFESSLERT